ncbi:hypothetical protein VIGAN_04190200 [Vigna angularis var. angularis]|uniref:Uncharacterized protein n=1 Tax=Vigna angularis var. angularis TaxID=157739 RepID=A0A0S3RV68_PHAAN|nr:hypothetical protein VIGAN_04190200 [Vigna angularis var. angularis]
MIFVNSGDGAANSGFGNAEKLVGKMGFLPSDFGSFRKWCLLGSSLLQIVALRPNLQIIANGDYPYPIEPPPCEE